MNSFVSISLDGHNSDTHSIIRISKDAFTQSLKGIEHLVKAGIRPQIIFSIHRKNAEYIDEMTVLCKSLNAESLKINFIMKICRAETMENTSDLLTIDEYIAVYKKYCKTLKSENFEIIFDIPNAFKSIHNLQECRGGTCGIKGILGVLSDGSVSICGIGNVRKDLNLGNIRHTTLSDIWNNNKIVNQIRNNIPDNLEGICKRCMFKQSCLGKCVADNYYKTDNLFSGNIFCEEAYQRGLFPLSRLIK